MSEDIDTTEGWGFPLNSRKAHYFVDGFSLCGKWMFLGPMENYQGKSSPDDCKSCEKKMKKRLGELTEEVLKELSGE